MSMGLCPTRASLKTKKTPAETYFGEIKFLQIVMLKKKIHTQKKLPTPLPTPTKIKWSGPKNQFRNKS